MNPYKLHLEKFFSRLLELRHTAARMKTVLLNSVKDFENNSEIKFISGSALIISDWTGALDNRCQRNYHTGISKITFKENYKEEVDNIISQECCLAFAQSFEALERFLKDCVFTKLQKDEKYRKELNIEEEILRENLPGGDKLFKWVKKAGDPFFSKSSKKNNENMKYKELWTILSEVRHAITHSSSIIKCTKVKKTDYHSDVFKEFFCYSSIDEQTVLIRLDYRKLDYLVKGIAEFAFQVFKALCMEENIDWNILGKKNTAHSTKK